MSWRIRANRRRPFDRPLSRQWRTGIAATLLLSLGTAGARGDHVLGWNDGVIPGLTGTTFNLTASSGYLSAADGLTLFFWGLAPPGGLPQYPAPTLIVQQGDHITVNLTNNLTLEPVSLVFPGHVVTTTGGTPGMLTAEAATGGGTVTYEFDVPEPGTYVYHSGTHPDLQIEMGLTGVLIVKPDLTNPRKAYNDTATEPDCRAWGLIANQHAASEFDREYLYFETEMDVSIHQLVEYATVGGAHGGPFYDQIDTTAWRPVYWFLNGRNFPDTVLPDNVPWMPHQPYATFPRCYPGERVLVRHVAGGRNSHPLHTHGGNCDVIAKNGRLLSSDGGVSADLSYSINTIDPWPGQAWDVIFVWTGYKMGWDIYGHAPGDMHEPCEYAPDHGKEFPVVLPEQASTTPGLAWSGSPFLGAMGDLPPGEGGYNAFGGFVYPWHVHHEKEVVNNDVFPGGNFSLLIIEPPGAPMHPLQ